MSKKEHNEPEQDWRKSSVYTQYEILDSLCFPPKVGAHLKIWHAARDSTGTLRNEAARALDVWSVLKQIEPADSVDL